MVLDSSAIVAVLLGESAAEAVITALESDPDRRISAATLVECGIVMQSRLGDAGVHELQLLVQRVAIRVEPVSEHQARLAMEAFRRYGKGRHAAGLNYGGCFTYALAADLGMSILHTGDDFTRCDIESIRGE